MCALCCPSFLTQYFDIELSWFLHTSKHYALHIYTDYIHTYASKMYSTDTSGVRIRIYTYIREYHTYVDVRVSMLRVDYERLRHMKTVPAYTHMYQHVCVHRHNKT